MDKLTWTKEKPVLTGECILLTADFFKGNDEPFQWEYDIFQIIKQTEGEKWYWAIIDSNSDEWGAYEDLKADLYAVIEPIKTWTNS